MLLNALANDYDLPRVPRLVPTHPTRDVDFEPSPAPSRRCACIARLEAPACSASRRAHRRRTQDRASTRSPFHHAAAGAVRWSLLRRRRRCRDHGLRRLSQRDHDLESCSNVSLRSSVSRLEPSKRSVLLLVLVESLVERFDGHELAVEADPLAEPGKAVRRSVTLRGARPAQVPSDGFPPESVLRVGRA